MSVELPLVVACLVCDRGGDTAEFTERVDERATAVVGFGEPRVQPVVHRGDAFARVGVGFDRRGELAQPPRIPMPQERKNQILFRREHLVEAFE